MAGFKADPKIAQRKRSEALAKLEEGIEILATSGSWQDYLEVQGRFHRYSFNNVMMILMQMPEASRVAGYGTWKQVGRQVKRGEKGITILAPIIKAVEDDGDEDGRRFVGCRTVSVFDISQTEGDEIPRLYEKLQGDDLGVFEALRGFAHAQGFKTLLEDCGKSNGRCRFAEQIEISVNSSLSPLHQAKTMAHELGHALLHSEQEYREHSLKSEKELEAESVAFVVLNALGLDSGGYSFAYVTGWMDGTDEAIAQLKASANRIQMAAKTILDWVEKNAQQPVGDESLCAIAA